MHGVMKKAGTYIVAKMCAVLKMALFDVFQIFLCQRSTLAQQTSGSLLIEKAGQLK